MQCKILRLTSDNALQALQASHDAQALPAELEQLHAELRQALQRAAQQGERAVKAEDELRGCMRNKEALAGSVAELESRCGQLQVGPHDCPAACTLQHNLLRNSMQRKVTRSQQAVLLTHVASPPSVILHMMVTVSSPLFSSSDVCRTTLSDG